MEERFETIHFTPCRLQFLIDNLIWIILYIVGIILMGADDQRLVQLAVAISVTTGIYLFVQYISMRRKLFILTGELLIYQRGVITRRADYIEFYRVIDFRESQSLFQQLFGLKDVIVYSGDRTTPELLIPGVGHKFDMIGRIRERVEFNKTRRGVYEITNRI